ncbi:hypothetical protein [Dyadobacter sediminis]|uniref:Uncharacterized protein n=1 Tax=Dyadobacter sediminis TaxID=1493691 RepID=A0A5R9K4J8_9BACT|nr:hypothetical protein [Dyadobacter sediminis]TLU88695.1 hypothetical protein FEM55_24630 [Dyadobacter sediminis]
MQTQVNQLLVSIKNNSGNRYLKSLLAHIAVLLKAALPEMKLEKTLVLQSGRSVRITRCEYLVEAGKSELDVLIKEPNEETFRPLIGLTHPKYWKLKKWSRISQCF